jgi:hypothetical protein
MTQHAATTDCHKEPMITIQLKDTYQLEVLDCNYGEEPYIPAGEADKLVRKMNQRRSAHDAKVVKIATDKFYLQWQRSRQIEDTRPPERCQIPLTRQQAFALYVAATVPSWDRFEDEFATEIDALWG